VRYILSIGGKRLRPAMVLMSCSLFTDAVHRAMKPALAFEVFHNFTLLHDDLMDQSSVRRGKQTVHEMWDANTAILSGDAMSILSYKLLSESEESHLKDLLQLFNITALQVCEGQQMDMNFESRTDVSVNEYLKMIELKTAVLIAACLRAGAIAGGADMLNADLMYECGRNLGIAFQIRDDYLDTYGDPDVFGKKIGNDIVTNKKTYLLITALEQSDGKQREELLRLIRSTRIEVKNKIDRVKKIYNDLGLETSTSDLAASYFEKATQYLNRVEAEPERKMALKELSHALMDRQQ
jgi:geranylgeranyl diphosphate synthase type II